MGTPLPLPLHIRIFNRLSGSLPHWVRPWARNFGNPVREAYGNSGKGGTTLLLSSPPFLPLEIRANHPLTLAPGRYTIMSVLYLVPHRSLA